MILLKIMDLISLVQVKYLSLEETLDDIIGSQSSSMLCSLDHFWSIGQVSLYMYNYILL